MRMSSPKTATPIPITALSFEGLPNTTNTIATGTSSMPRFLKTACFQELGVCADIILQEIAEHVLHIDSRLPAYIVRDACRVAHQQRRFDRAQQLLVFDGLHRNAGQPDQRIEHLTHAVILAAADVVHRAWCAALR